MSARALPVVLQAAVDITGARAGWALAAEGDQAEVVAAAGEGAGDAMGVTIDVHTGAAGFVIASGEPLAVAPRPDDPIATDGVAAALGRTPSSVLCVPCGFDGDVLGALELIDKTGGGPFLFDDVELATVLGDVIGALLADGGGGRPAVPTPDELRADLRRLAAADPARYAAVAVAMASLLSNG
ncbi:MAG: GAF domain-containing protein [Acidimicrobiales bacterium]